jgi:hypothetical protein
MNLTHMVDGVASSYLRIVLVNAGFNETTSNFFLQLSHILAGGHSMASSPAASF